MSDFSQLDDVFINELVSNEMGFSEPQNVLTDSNAVMELAARYNITIDFMDNTAYIKSICFNSQSVNGELHTKKPCGDWARGVLEMYLMIKADKE